MRRALLLFLTLYSCHLSLAQSAPPVGQWREHLPYQQSFSLTIVNNKIWAATPFSIFSVDPVDNSIDRFSKMTGLTETGIRTIGNDISGTQVLVAYNSGNIDIISDDGVSNVPDIYLSPLISDKTINQVYSAAGKTWLAGNEAIYVLNTGKHEIQDTYIIGAGGNKIKVYSLAFFADRLYAATSEGVRYAAITGPNLSDFRNWQTDTLVGSSSAPILQLVAVTDKIFARSADSVFVSSGSGWSLFYTDRSTLSAIRESGNNLAITERTSTGPRIIVRTKSGAPENVISNTSIRAPSEVLFLDNEYWLADSITGLSRISTTSVLSLNPESPSSLTSGDTRSTPGLLVVAGGGVNENWQPLNRPGVISLFKPTGWTNYTSGNLTALTNFPDIIPVAIDPVDQSVWAGSFGGGLLQLKQDGSTQIFAQNSFIKQAYSAPGSYRVTGLRFDAENNLWISNYGAEENIVVRKADGSSRSMKVPFPIASSVVSDIEIDDLNQKWIIAPAGNGLICFNHGASIDNPGDDQWRWYRNGVGNGSLPDDHVLSIAIDKDGFLWVGTTQGIGIIRCTQDVFAGPGCEAIRPVVQQDNFAGYLFSDEEVQAIAVDGANRKWIGTKNGLWLLSADGEKILYRFAADNSPLLANDVKKLAIDPTTGEVFITTSQGICSFRGTATEAATNSKSILVFPNPVPPAYKGSIAIRGLTKNALVKITELNGNLLFQTRSLGGQAIWNGRDYKGRQISSGIYLVLVTDENSKEQVATKIVYINR